MSTRTADARRANELRRRGMAMFDARLDGDSLMALCLGAMPEFALRFVRGLVGHAFQLGYEAGWDESRNATDD